jgi:3-mercaptopyruvate sulfurtransferase SseA
MAAELMQTLGFKHVYDIEGGMTAWQDNGLPSTHWPRTRFHVGRSYECGARSDGS